MPKTHILLERNTLFLYAVCIGGDTEDSAMASKKNKDITLEQAFDFWIEDAILRNLSVATIRDNRQYMKMLYNSFPRIHW